MPGHLQGVEADSKGRAPQWDSTEVAKVAVQGLRARVGGRGTRPEHPPLR